MIKKVLFVVLLVFTSIAFANSTKFGNVLVNNNKFLLQQTINQKSVQLSKIPNAKVTVVNRTIKVSGANLLAVYDLTGQAVANKDLNDGIYIIKISKNKKIAAIKVVIRS